MNYCPSRILREDSKVLTPTEIMFDEMGPMERIAVLIRLPRMRNVSQSPEES